MGKIEQIRNSRQLRNIFYLRWQQQVHNISFLFRHDRIYDKLMALQHRYVLRVDPEERNLIDYTLFDHGGSTVQLANEDYL